MKGLKYGIIRMSAHNLEGKISEQGISQGSNQCLTEQRKGKDKLISRKKNLSYIGLYVILNIKFWFSSNLNALWHLSTNGYYLSIFEKYL